MKWDLQSDTQSCTIRFRSQPKLAYSNVFFSALFLFLIGYFVSQARDSKLLIFALYVPMGLIFISVGIHRMFSTSSLIIEADFLSLDRRLFGMGTCRKFAKSDIEYIGYQKEFSGYRSHTDSALALMVHEDVTPVRFAQTISPADAQAVLDKVKQNGSWLSERIRPIGTPLF